MHPLLIGAALPAAALVYGFVEAKLYRLYSYRLPVLPVGAEDLEVLQITDLHLRVGSDRLTAFLHSLSGRRFDLVLATGDLLGDPEAMPRCAEALNALQARFGRYFVLGSSDYYAPKFKNYFDYFSGKRRLGTRRNRTEDFRELLTGEGWVELTNRTVFTDIDGLPCQITGLDDPYLRRDDRSLLVRSPQAEFALCVVHDPAPYADAAAAGFDLVVGGHTHGGQVRLPFLGAMVTNSKLPRRFARGPARLDGSWLFVSPGLGTGKYAPFRFLCRPEASLLTLSSRDQVSDVYTSS